MDLMEIEFGEFDLQTLQFSNSASSPELKELLVVFDDANRRNNAFLTEKVLSYQKAEMGVSILPIATYVVAKIGEEVAGYVALLDNYIVGIYVAGNFSNWQIELHLLNAVKQTVKKELEVIVFMKNSVMLELYLVEGFEITDRRICRRCNELTVTLTYIDKPLQAAESSKSLWINKIR